MPTSLMMAYETLETEDKKLVEQLIYSLVKKVKNPVSKEKDFENKDESKTLDSLVGILKDSEISSMSEIRAMRIKEKYGL